MNVIRWVGVALKEFLDDGCWRSELARPIQWTNNGQNQIIYHDGGS